MEKIRDIADEFVRVRLTQIESSNLKLFDFDYDLTFMVFFLSPEETVYARYGGRCEQGPDERQSLAGLRYTMKSVLAEHSAENRRFAPMEGGKPFFIGEIAPRSGLGRCIHCHQAKEVMYNKIDRDGDWDLNLAFRFPPPDNLGLKLEVDRSNIVERIAADSVADKAGLKEGDIVNSLNDVPIHSFGDAQYALDRAPKIGSIPVSWQRGAETHESRIELPDRWWRTDITWRPSLQNLIASPRLYGKDLTTDEKTALGLKEKQLAFRLPDTISEQPRLAGIQGGDIVYGVEGRHLEMGAYDFQTYFRSHFIKGEDVVINIIRDGMKLERKMRLAWR